MYAFTPASSIASKAHQETLRMWRAAHAREQLSADSLEYRKSLATRAASTEKQAIQRTLQTMERRQAKVQQDNLKWKLRSLTALDVRVSLDVEYRNFSHAKMAQIYRRIAKVEEHRENLERTLLAENALRGKLMHE